MMMILNFLLPILLATNIVTASPMVRIGIGIDNTSPAIQSNVFATSPVACALTHMSCCPFCTCVNGQIDCQGKKAGTKDCTYIDYSGKRQGCKCAGPQTNPNAICKKKSGLFSELTEAEEATSVTKLDVPVEVAPKPPTLRTRISIGIGIDEGHTSPAPQSDIFASSPVACTLTTMSCCPSCTCVNGQINCQGKKTAAGNECTFIDTSGRRAGCRCADPKTNPKAVCAKPKELFPALAEEVKEPTAVTELKVPVEVTPNVPAGLLASAPVACGGLFKGCCSSCTCVDGKIDCQGKVLIGGGRQFPCVGKEQDNGRSYGCHCAGAKTNPSAICKKTSSAPDATIEMESVVEADPSPDSQMPEPEEPVSSIDTSPFVQDDDVFAAAATAPVFCPLGWGATCCSSCSCINGQIDCGSTNAPGGKTKCTYLDYQGKRSGCRCGTSQMKGLCPNKPKTMLDLVVQAEEL